MYHFIIINCMIIICASVFALAFHNYITCVCIMNIRIISISLECSLHVHMLMHGDHNHQHACNILKCTMQLCTNMQYFQ